MPDEPRVTPLRRILKQPGARRRTGYAIVSLLSVGLVSIAVIGFLLIWHLIRRGRLIQDRLAPPRDIRLPDLAKPSLPTFSSSTPTSNPNPSTISPDPPT